MNTPKLDEKIRAQRLYIQTDLSQSQIADILGIHRKTLYLWIVEGKWTRSRISDNLTPSRLIQQYYTQLETLNYQISLRRDKIPDSDDLDAIRKLTAAIRTLTPRQSKNQTAATMCEFLDHLKSSSSNETILSELKPHVLSFIASKDPSLFIEDFFTPPPPEPPLPEQDFSTEPEPEAEAIKLAQSPTPDEQNILEEEEIKNITKFVKSLSQSPNFPTGEPDLDPETFQKIMNRAWSSPTVLYPNLSSTLTPALTSSPSLATALTPTPFYLTSISPSLHSSSVSLTLSLSPKAAFEAFQNNTTIDIPCHNYLTINSQDNYCKSSTSAPNAPQQQFFNHVHGLP